MASVPTGSELSAAADWFARASTPPGLENSTFPLAFLYAGRPSAGLLPAWEGEALSSETATRQSRTLRLRDPETGLECRCELMLFPDFPAVEWVGYFRNTGSLDTPILSEIRALSAVFPMDEQGLCTLHYARGSGPALNDFEPLQAHLNPGEHRLASQLGQSSNGMLPFFNLQMDDRGVIGALGWTGDWEALFRRERNRRGEVEVQAGMQRTHLRLHPGEAIRTPRILLLFWEGDRIHGHNLLRRFLLTHHCPRPGGELLQGPLCHANWGENLAEQQIAKARWWKEQGLPCDVFWVDAGWYGDAPYQEDSTVFNSQWARQVGNWQPNPALYPQGLGPLGETVAEAGMKFLLWVETERACVWTRLAQEHPEWMLGPINDNCLVNLGLPEAREGVTDLISGLIQEAHLGVYRQDFNMSPAPFWEQADAPDRIGMSEIRHIEGLYKFWDDLLARHPGLYIDNCAGGGHRLDLETISRSIPLWRSDYQCYLGFDPIGMQGQTQGLSLWVPLSAGVWEGTSLYAARSAMGPAVVLSTNRYETEPPPPVPLDLLRQGLEEQARARPFFYGDFYPLLAYSLADDVWAAWQWDRPDLGQGLVLLFRRQGSPYPQMEVRFQGLIPDAKYEITDADSGEVWDRTGRNLQERGILAEISQKPGSRLWWYRKIG